MRRFLSYLTIASGMIAIVAGGLAWWAHHQTQAVPEFYRTAQERMPADVAEASRQLAKQFERLTERVQQVGRWEATFTDEQINAWLVSELEDHFPNVLPRGVEEPRVVIEDGRVLVAARYRDPRIDTVVSFEIRARLTDKPNVVAVEVVNLRAGALPLPLGRFLDNISRNAAQGDLEVQWDERDGQGPIALVEIPSDHPGYVRKPVIVESVELGDGHLRLAGHTGPEARRTFRPRGPLYRLASAGSHAIPHP